jgi:hypothetical protein
MRMASRRWSSSFLDLGEVGSDTRKSSLATIRVYTSEVEPYRSSIRV